VRAKAGFLAEATLKHFGLNADITNPAQVTAKPSDTLAKFLDEYLEYEEIAVAIDEKQTRLDWDRNEVTRLSHLLSRLHKNFGKERKSAEYRPFKKERILPKLQKIFTTLATKPQLSWQEKENIKRVMDYGIIELNRVELGIRREIENNIGDVLTEDLTPAQVRGLMEDISNLDQEYSLVKNVIKEVTLLSKAMSRGRGRG